MTNYNYILTECKLKSIAGYFSVRFLEQPKTLMTFMFPYETEDRRDRIKSEALGFANRDYTKGNPFLNLSAKEAKNVILSEGFYRKDVPDYRRMRNWRDSKDGLAVNSYRLLTYLRYISRDRASKT